MQEPVLLEKRQEYSRFCEQARLLLERVTETKINTNFLNDITQVNRLERFLVKNLGKIMEIFCCGKNAHCF